MVEQDKVERVFRKRSPDGLPGLKEAVDATLELRRVLASFRSRCLRYPEEGRLYQLVESWYVVKYVSNLCVSDYPKTLEERNPYAKFKADHSKPMQEWSLKLDFLLNEIPPRKFTRRMNLGLKEEEVELLMNELTDNGSLARLIRISPYLTHEENIMIAVVDTRLWLNESELSVDILSGSVSYKDVRMGVPVKRDNDVPPSTFEMLLKEDTVNAYWSMQLNSSFMYQPKPTDFPEKSRNSYFARLARVRTPHSHPGRMSEAEHATTLTDFPMEDMGAVELEDWKWNETALIYKHLARLIFNVEV